jgi:hypothetical protein
LIFVATRPCPDYPSSPSSFSVLFFFFLSSFLEIIERRGTIPNPRWTILSWPGAC